MKIQLRVEPSKLSDYELQVEDDELARLWSRVEDHGGSPGEWIIERWDDIFDEARRRNLPWSCITPVS